MAVEARELFSCNCSLKELVKGQQGEIIETPTDPLLASLGFRAGKTVCVLTKEVCNGPFICSVDDRKVAIGEEVAKKIVMRIKQ